MRPHVIISDLHLGVGDARDNFTHHNRLNSLIDFLHWTTSLDAVVVIAGDLLELWQTNFSSLMVHWNTPLSSQPHGVVYSLFDLLAGIKAIYVLGNHDIDLLEFVNSPSCNRYRHVPWIGHPFFSTMTSEFSFVAGDRTFRVIHGHKGDSYCLDPKPGKGRISAIYAGIWEDRHGSPMRSKYRSVESATVGRMERVIGFANRLLGRPSRLTQLHRNLLNAVPLGGSLIFGHTHKPGILLDKISSQEEARPWGYNCGSWAEASPPTFVKVDPDGTAGVFEWVDNQPRPYHNVLPW